MKDNKRTLFLSSPVTAGIQTSRGILKIPVVSHVRFNQFEGSRSQTGTYISEFVTGGRDFQVVEGIQDSDGEFELAEATLRDFDIYGQTVYTDVKFDNQVGFVAPLDQKGFRLPLGGRVDFANDRRLLVKEQSQLLNPSSNLRGLTYLLKIKVLDDLFLNDKALLSIAEKSGAASFTIGIENFSNPIISIIHHADSELINHAKRTLDISSYKSEWLTLVVSAGVNEISGDYYPFLGPSRVYRTINGELITSQTYIASSYTRVELEGEVNTYIGYGALSGNIDSSFDITKFLVDVEIAELTVFEGILTEDQMDLIAKSHLDENHHKSGFNSRSPRKVLQLLDAQTQYPASSIPFEPAEPATFFNDTTTKVFGSTELLMFPEMLPARLFSGSDDYRGAIGDSNPFYRDIHNTTFDKRLVAPGEVRHGISHKETELLNSAVRNSPVSISQDTKILGGRAESFDDNHPLIDIAAMPAVSGDVYPGLQQRMGDHIAIVIDLDPTSETTIGVERNESGVPTGRVTSMAYYNFTTKKWETAGKNNDFIVPGAVTLGPIESNNDPTDAAILDNRRSYIKSAQKNLFEKAAVGFAGTSGFSILKDEKENCLAPLSQRGMPTSNYGFPVHKKYEAKDDQLIDMSKYIDAPFLLERVSFEFGAGVEDSGPHSLGYKTETPKLEINQNSIQSTQDKFGIEVKLAPLQPQAQNSNPFGGLGGIPNLIPIDTGVPNLIVPTQYQNIGTKINRSEFLNGSKIKVMHQLRDGDELYKPFAFKSDIHRMLASGRKINTFETAELLIKNKSDNSDAAIFLKTAVGNRDNYQKFDNGSRKITVNQISKPASYIPVLPGGVNGVVTGSSLLFRQAALEGLYKTYEIGPFCFPESNSQDEISSQMHFTSEGGTPFWRADTFFLLRQSPRPAKKNTSFKFKANVGYDSPMFPLAPYAGTIQLLGTPGINDERFRVDALGKKRLISDDTREGAFLFETSLNGSTSRELITFGQMTHYGYTNAADSYFDSIWDEHEDYPQSSGSHSQFFIKQIFEPDNTPIKASLFGQAIKYATYETFDWTSVPSNVDDLFNETSMLSDLPDTYQGQYAISPFITEVTNANSNTFGIRPIRPYIEQVPQGGTLDDIDLTSRNDGNNNAPRYALSASKHVAKTTLQGQSVSQLRPTAYSLDAFAASPIYTSNEGQDDDEFVYGAYEKSQAANVAKIVGSGFSIISTPAHLAAESEPNSSLHDWNLYGNFNKASSLSKKNWLESGLARELNIFLDKNAIHEGLNPDFNDNWCGFTLMTASTCWRPWSSPGRESASIGLQANVYKRQYLNYRKKLRIDMPVKSTIPNFLESPGYWVATAQRVEWLGDGVKGELSDQKNYVFQPNPGPNVYNGIEDDVRWPQAAGGDVTYQVAKPFQAKRFHNRYALSIIDGGWRPGPDADSIPTGRYFVKGSAAMVPKKAEIRAPIPMGSTLFFKPGFFDLADNQDFDPALISAQTPNTSNNASIRWQDYGDLLDASIMSGSEAEEPTKESLYILKPGDKLIIGAQPALPGWNIGSGLPNNRHASKYGIWDYVSSSIEGKAMTHDLESDGKTLRDGLMNLEDPYEPCHGLTMLAGPSRVVLYGTLLKDNKPRFADSKQKLRSAAVHEALHYDNPVLDQFLLGTQDEYVGSYLEQHVTGNMVEGNRGVAATAGDGNLVFSGSFQRFTKALEDSKVFYDTLLQNPFDIATIDGASKRIINDQGYTIVNLHYQYAEQIQFLIDYVDYIANTVDFEIGYAVSNRWKDAFPFESQYSNVSRLVNRDLNFLGVNNSYALCLESPTPTGIAAALSFPITTFSGSGDILQKEQWLQEALNGGYDAVLNQGITVSTISNMSNVAKSQFLEFDNDLTEIIEKYRLATAVILGFGRQNRKQLDADLFPTSVTDKFNYSFVDSPNNILRLEGFSPRFHPAGFKYGYMNCDHLYPTTVHRGDHYGQFRDMLEQRLYSKVYNFGDEYTERGESEAAVSCFFVDRDGLPILDPTRTQCLNLSTTMTSSKPYIEGEVLRDIIIISEPVIIT